MVFPVSNTVLNKCGEELAKALKILFQKTIDEGRLPGDWKQAKVTAIHKKGSRNRQVTTDQLA